MTSAGGPVLLVVAGGAVSHAAIARTAELAAGAPVTVVGVGTAESSRTDPGSARPRPQVPGTGETRDRIPSPRLAPVEGAGEGPEQVRRTVALAMSVLEDTGIMATGHIVTGAPARAVARVARACGARAVILDQPGTPPGRPPAAGLMAELRRRMYGTGVVVLAETDRRGGWVSA
jgi:hypothetical protein